MSSEKKSQEVDEAQVELALRHFRESVHGWSEREFARPRAVQSAQRGAWWTMRSRVFAWGMAAVLAVAAVSAPIEVRHRQEQQRQIEKQKELEAQQKRDEALRQQALAMNDEDLLSHVDSDIAQATPDAMEPLASLMSDSETR